MTRRRDWLRGVVGGGAAAFVGSWRAAAQEPSAGNPSRRVARRPVMPDPARTALRPVVQPWEARPPVDPELAGRLEAIRDRHGIPGMVGAIIQGPSVVSVAAAGVRKVGEPDPIHPGDRIHLGSCTKAITATLLGTLFEEGALSESSTIGQVFPEYAPRLHPDFRDATVSHLLTHRAGLPHDADWWNLPGRTPTEKRYAALVELCTGPPASRPGRSYAYSNAGYAIAGLMAEHVTGASWENLTRARIFEPLYMYSAGFGPPGLDDSVREAQPYGHHLVRGRVTAIRHDNPEVMGPAGTVHCSILDWAKFAVAHLRGERAGGLLSAQTYRGLHTPPPGPRSEYAGGWVVADRPWGGGKVLNHAGSNTMWYATVWLAPLRDFGVLVAVNMGGDGAGKACDEAAGALIERHRQLLPGG